MLKCKKEMFSYYKFLMLSLVGVVLTLILALIYYFAKVSGDDFHNMDAYSYPEEDKLNTKDCGQVWGCPA